MKIYNYQAKDKEGKNIKGVIEAVDEKQAAAILRDQKYLIISLKEKKEDLLSLKRFFTRITENNIVDFTRQLATMINAGLPLTEALVILKEQEKNLLMRKVIDDLLGDVQGGASLAKALLRYPNYFSKVYCSLIKAGEAAGVLDRVSLRLAENLEKQRDFRAKTKGALIYPAIIFSVMIVVIIIMMIVVFPRLTSMYKDFNIPMPAPTLFLMKISELTVKFLPFLIIIFIGLIIFLRNLVKTEVGRLAIDRFIFKIPLIGNLQKKLALTEFTRTLSLLVGTGVPIIEALNIVSDAVGNQVYKNAIKQSAVEVEKGLGLAVTFADNPDFPTILPQMIKIGEESGKLDEVLLRLSAVFESEAERLVKGLTTAMEPLIMIILGIGVGFLVISVIMPIYNLTSQF